MMNPLAYTLSALIGYKLYTIKLKKDIGLREFVLNVEKLGIF